MLEKIKQFIYDRQSTLISGLSALLIIVLSFLLFSYFSQVNKQTAPKQTITVEEATMSGLLSEATRTSLLDRIPSSSPKPTSTPTPSPSPEKEAKKPEVAPSAPKTAENTAYTVVRGDSLSLIAQKFYGSPDKYTLISSLPQNNITNPNLIHAGNVFTIPSATLSAVGSPASVAQLPAAGIVAPVQKLSNPTTHTVVSGDTLWDLAVHYYGSGLEWHKIQTANLDRVGYLPNNSGSRALILPSQTLTIPIN